MKLNLYVRPWVEFDVTSRQHRKWYAEYMKTGNWGSCPVRFVDAEDSGNLAGALQRKISAFYVGREFGFKEDRRAMKIGG